MEEGEKFFFALFLLPTLRRKTSLSLFFPPFHMGMEINVKKWKGEGEVFFLALRNNSESPKQIRK